MAQEITLSKKAMETVSFIQHPLVESYSYEDGCMVSIREIAVVAEICGQMTHIYSVGETIGM